MLGGPQEMRIIDCVPTKSMAASVESSVKKASKSQKLELWEKNCENIVQTT